MGDKIKKSGIAILALIGLNVLAGQAWIWYLAIGGFLLFLILAKIETLIKNKNTRK